MGEINYDLLHRLSSNNNIDFRFQRIPKASQESQPHPNYSNRPNSTIPPDINPKKISNNQSM